MTPVPQPDGPATAPLPAPLARWSTELLGAAPAAESLATCGHCAMCAGADAPPLAQRIVFDPLVRCCTYRPFVPNYLAGAILADPATSAHGRESLLQRMAQGEATPLGVRTDAAYQLLYRHARAPAFGRGVALRCPHHLQDGGCGIWLHRPAVCATWHCKHDRGAVGDRLWTALNRALGAAEHALAMACLLAMGWPERLLSEAQDELQRDGIDAAVLDRRRDPERDARLWGTWLGREAGFYEACAQKAQMLDWADVQASGGSSLRALAADARQAGLEHDDLALPAKLRCGRFEVVGAAAGQLWLATYSAFDPLEVDPEVLALAALCDGRSTALIVSEHEAATGHRPTRLQLRSLLDHGVLLPG
jgi:hypothetical protein